MGFDADAPQAPIAAVVAEARRAWRPSSPFESIVRDVQLQVFRSVSLPIAQTLTEAARPWLPVAMSPILQIVQDMKPQLDTYVLNQLKPALAVFQIVAKEEAFSVLSQQRPAWAAASLRPLPIPTPQQLDEAEAAIHASLPETPEESEELEETIAEVASSPERLSLLDRATKGITRDGVESLSVAGLMILLWWVLHQLAVLPDGATDLSVIAVVLTAMQLVQNRK